MKDLRQEMKKISLELGVTQEVECNKEESKEFRKMKRGELPPDIHASENGAFYRHVKTDLSEDEIKELFLYRQMKYLRTIKNSVVFFVILTIIGMISFFILYAF